MSATEPSSRARVPFSPPIESKSEANSPPIIINSSYIKTLDRGVLDEIFYLLTPLLRNVTDAAKATCEDIQQEENVNLEKSLEIYTNFQNKYEDFFPFHELFFMTMKAREMKQDEIEDYEKAYSWFIQLDRMINELHDHLAKSKDIS
jgi:hypothetical protein